MASILRSKPMLLVQLYIQIEAAHDTIDELGKLGLVQFRDVSERNLSFGWVGIDAWVSSILM